ncbi:MAG: GAF domain-containing SpoIIE family protein phosphatase [Janthinobacterium lividum]
MNFSFTQLFGSRAGGISWLSALSGILLFALLSLLLTFLLPGRYAHTNDAALAITGIAVLLSIVIAPFLIRIFDGMQQTLTRQNSELRSLHVIDRAIAGTMELPTILQVAIKEVTLAVDGEFGALWLLSDSETKPEPVAQAFYNLSPGMQGPLTDRLNAGAADLARRTGVTQRRHGMEDSWGTDRTAAFLKIRNVIVVPILHNDQVLGLVLVGNRGNSFSPLEGFSGSDQTLLEAVSATVGVAVQNARLYRETLRRDEILRALVARTGEAVEASSDAPLLMQILADEAARILSCRRVAVYGYEETSQQFIPLAAHDTEAVRDETEKGRALRHSFYDYPLARTVEDLPGRVTRGTTSDDTPAYYVQNAAAALGLNAKTAAFLNSPGYLFALRSRDQRAIGLLCLLDTGSRLRQNDSAGFALALAAQASVTLENARLFAALQAAHDHQRDIAETLQKSLLPVVPERAGVIEFAHKYQAALEEALIGGDFYDLFSLGGSLLGIVMADVSGKGLKAAVQTAMLKYTLRGFALETPNSPGQVLARVNDVLCSPMSSHDGFVTLFYGVLNTDTGEMAYASAGHEPPLLRVAQTGLVDGLPASDGLALGCLPGVPFGECLMTFAPGDLLLLYTDGLTEARAADQSFLGLDGLASLLPTADVSAESAVSTIYDAVTHFAANVRRDDVAMLALRRLP